MDLERAQAAYRVRDIRDMSRIIPIERRAMVKQPNWLDNKKAVAEKFAEVAKENTGLPSLSFPPSTPVFVKTAEDSKMTKTQYGQREIVVVDIIEPETLKDNPAGTRLTMWVTQEVFRTKIEQFRNKDGKIPAGLELCIVNLGKVKGDKFSYNDYYIGTAEQGKEILKEVS